MFLDLLSSFLLTNTNSQIDIILGHFNIDGLNLDAVNRLKNTMAEFHEIVQSPTHINGGLLDHVYVRKTIFDSYEISCVKHCVNFSDHDAVKIKLSSKENVDTR